jgi:hypothetical protein
MKLLEWIFEFNFCEYNGEHYKLESGPIGLGVTGEVAIIYMEDFQQRALATCEKPPEDWPWYVDDSEALMESIQHAEQFLAHLNSIEPESIEFMMEKEEENRLPVLDLSQEKREDGGIKFGIHYKKTHTNINIKKKSGHPDSVKKSVIQGFAERARVLCSTDTLESELENIEKVFVANGFDRKDVNEKMKRKTEQSEMEGVTGDLQEEHKRGAISVPYLRGVSEEYRRMMNRHGFRTAFKSGTKVNELQNKVKRPLGDKKRDVVYKIECGCGECVYIGQTKQRWDERKKQHCDNIRYTEQDLITGTESSKLKAEMRTNGIGGGLVKHVAMECEKRINWEKSGPLTQERGWKQRRVKESIETYKQGIGGKKLMNQCDFLDSGWKRILKEDYQKTSDRKHHKNQKETGP